MGVFTTVPLLFVRANSVALVFHVLNMAHDSPDSERRSWPRPACWNVSAPNVPTNSIERPGPNVPVVASSALSTTACPPPTLTLPPPVHGVLDQPLGRLVPLNSAPTVGAKMTSPFPVWET